MLTIAGGIVIAFFAIRFLLNWGDKSRVRQIEAWNSRYERERAEKERLRLLAIRLRETNPQLYAQADARVPQPRWDGSAGSDGKILVIDPFGKTHAVWAEDVRRGKHPDMRVPIPKELSDIGKAAEAICRELGLPPP